MLNSEMMSILACPICKNDLEWVRRDNELLCLNPNCGKKYPIGTNDIPILVPNQEEYEKKYGWKYRKKND